MSLARALPVALHRVQEGMLLHTPLRLNALLKRPLEDSFAWRTSPHFIHPSDEWSNYQAARFPGADLSFHTKVQD